jgi:phosphopantetheinyl transferase (holo-ACP synthase)
MFFFDKKIKLLEQAIKEFNEENNVNLIFTYKLNNTKITTNTWQVSIVYDSENLVASVIITQN